MQSRAKRGKLANEGWVSEATVECARQQTQTLSAGLEVHASSTPTLCQVPISSWVCPRLKSGPRDGRKWAWSAARAPVKDPNELVSGPHPRWNGGAGNRGQSGP